MPSKETGFTGVSLKTGLAQAVQKFVDDHPDAGYKSISDFVHDAVRHRIEEVKKTYVATPEETQT